MMMLVMEMMIIMTMTTRPIILLITIIIMIITVTKTIIILIRNNNESDTANIDNNKKFWQPSLDRVSNPCPQNPSLARYPPSYRHPKQRAIVMLKILRVLSRGPFGQEFLPIGQELYRSPLNKTLSKAGRTCSVMLNVKITHNIYVLGPTELSQLK